jgi:hypothetical protein
MYDLFTNVMLKSSNHWDIKEEFYQYGSIQGPRTYLAATYFIAPGMSLTPYLQSWFVHDNNTSDIANVPDLDEKMGLKIKKFTDHGNIALDVAHRKSLGSFYEALLSSEYKITRQLNAKIELGYHQLAMDTETLYIGGYRNDANLELEYTLAQSDLISMQLTQNFFYTQDKKHLADGNLEKLGYEHYFWLEHPDFSTLIYAQGEQYYDKINTLPNDILKLVPTGTSATTNFIIPPSSTEFGITLQTGMKYLEDYTHSWKPFASATVMRNSVTGIGRIFTLGVAGTVFGRDHLALYYENGTDQAPGVQRELLIGASYRYYF